MGFLVGAAAGFGILALFLFLIRFAAIYYNLAISNFGLATPGLVAAFGLIIAGVAASGVGFDLGRATGATGATTGATGAKTTGAATTGAGIITGKGAGTGAEVSAAAANALLAISSYTIY